MKPTQKFIYSLLIALIIDAVLLQIYVYYINPDPSVSIYLLVAIPLIIFVNLILCLVFYLFKLKRLSALAAINTVLAPVIFYFLFDSAINNYDHRNWQSWAFSRGDTTFTITRSKKDNYFGIDYSLRPGSAIGVSGTYHYEKDVLVLKIDSSNLVYRIKNGYLTGFRRQPILLHEKS